MKKLANVVEVDGEGIVALLGEHVLLFCMSYFYAGKLVGVNDTCVQLEDAHIVYETGGLRDEAFKDAQALPGDVWYVQMAAIESFGVSGK